MADVVGVDNHLDGFGAIPFWWVGEGMIGIVDVYSLVIVVVWIVECGASSPLYPQIRLGQANLAHRGAKELRYSAKKPRVKRELVELIAFGRKHETPATSEISWLLVVDVARCGDNRSATLRHESSWHELIDDHRSVFAPRSDLLVAQGCRI